MKPNIPRPVLVAVLFGLVVLTLAAVGGLAGAESPPVDTQAQALTAPTVGTYPDLPQAMTDLMAQGMTMAEAAHAIDPGPPPGTKIDLGNGHFVIRMSGTIPEGMTLEPIVVPPHAPETDDPTDYSPPPYLYPREVPLYRDLMVKGEGFIIVQGNDGYLHIER